MRDQPRQSKYRKAQKGSNKGLVKGGAFVQEGDFGLKALDRGFITGKQIEACRVAINRKLGKRGTFSDFYIPPQTGLKETSRG